MKDALSYLVRWNINTLFLVFFISISFLFAGSSCVKKTEKKVEIKFIQYVHDFAKIENRYENNFDEGILVQINNNLDSSIYLNTDKDSLYFLYSTLSYFNCATTLGNFGVGNNGSPNLIEIPPKSQKNLLLGIALKLLKDADILKVQLSYWNHKKEINKLNLIYKINKGMVLEEIKNKDKPCLK